MTDIELIVLAAKAAGLIGCWVDSGLNIGSNAFPVVWNPLEDDGDALRLAVKLGIDVSQAQVDYYDKNSTDPYAATRRAIVLTVAEIGNMP